MPRLTSGPFRYKRYADSYLDAAMRYAHMPVKQAVISPSALSLMYPADEIPGYSREEFIDDLLLEHETEIRRCLQRGAHNVQIDVPALRAYGKAVFANTEASIANLTDDDLNRTIDLTAAGFGNVPLPLFLTIFTGVHTGMHTGEISCLKGLQGMQGYPF